MDLRFNQKNEQYVNSHNPFSDKEVEVTDDTDTIVDAELVETQAVEDEIPDDMPSDTPNMAESRYNIGMALSGIHPDNTINADDFTFSQNNIDMPDKTFQGTGIKEKNLDNMTEFQLKTELSFAQTQLKEKQDTLISIKGDTNPVIKDLKKNVEETKKIYKEQAEFVNKEQVNQKEYFEQKLENKKNEISKKDSEISDKDKEISSREETYDNIVEAIEMIENGIDRIKDDKNSLYKKYLGLLNNQLIRAKEEEKIAKLALENSKKELKILNFEKQKLEKEQKEIKKREDDLDKKIMEDNNELHNVLNNYNKAKSAYEKEKNSAINIVEEEVKQAEKYVEKIETKLEAEKQKELNNGFDTKKISDELAMKIETEYGQNFKQVIKELNLMLHCSTEKTIQILKKEFE